MKNLLKFAFISLIAIACSEDSEMPVKPDTSGLEAMKARIVGKWDLQSVTLASTLSESIVGQDSIKFHVPTVNTFPVYRMTYIFENEGRAQRQVVNSEIYYITYEVFVIDSDSYAIRTSEGDVLKILNNMGFLVLQQIEEYINSNYELQYFYVKTTD